MVFIKKINCDYVCLMSVQHHKMEGGRKGEVPAGTAAVPGKLSECTP